MPLLDLSSQPSVFGVSGYSGAGTKSGQKDEEGRPVTLPKVVSTISSSSSNSVSGFEWTDDTSGAVCIEALGTLVFARQELVVVCPIRPLVRACHGSHRMSLRTSKASRQLTLCSHPKTSQVVSAPTHSQTTSTNVNPQLISDLSFLPSLPLPLHPSLQTGNCLLSPPSLLGSAV